MNTARWFAAPIATACLLLPGLALASPAYPGVVAEHLSLDGAPPCALCHADGVTGAGTVTTPFGSALRARGLVGGADEASLRAALDQLELDAHDADEDGVLDVDELREGSDPNVAGGALELGEPAVYGCFASVAPRAPSSGGIGALMLGLVGWLRRRGRAGRGGGSK